MTTDKNDAGKARFDLVPPRALLEMARVLTHGAAVYKPNNWRDVPDFKDRYTAALLRHVNAYQLGQRKDPKSGMHPLMHAACCAFFMAELDLEAGATPSDFMAELERALTPEELAGFQRDGQEILRQYRGDL